MPHDKMTFHAVIAGVGPYENPYLSDLPSTVADARELARILKDPDLCAYPEENVAELTGSLATVDGLRSALIRLRDAPASGTTVIVLFSLAMAGASSARAGRGRICACARRIPLICRAQRFPPMSSADSLPASGPIAWSSCSIAALLATPHN